MSSYDEQQRINQLINLLCSSNGSESYQETIFAALIAIGEPTINPLIEAITTRAFDSFTIRMIFRVFTHMDAVRAGDQRVVDLLIKLLTDEDTAIASDASIALGIIADPRAVLPLIEVLRHWKNLRQWQDAFHALIAIDEPAIAHLLATLHDSNNNLRCNAVEILGKIGNSETVVPLIDMLRDEDAHVRGAAAQALARIGDRKALEPIKALLNDVDKYARAWAIYAITDLGGNSVFENIVNALSDPAEHVRRAAVASLGKINDPQVVGLLIESLNDPSELVICEAIDKLYPIEDEPILPALLSVQQKYSGLHDEHSVKLSVSQAIRRIRRER